MEAPVTVDRRISRLGRAVVVSEVARSARAACRPAGLRGVAVEAAWIAAHAVAYPWGIAQEKVSPESARYSCQELSPIQRSLLHGDVGAAGTPILLVHGLVDNRSIFTVLRRALRRRGFGRVFTYNYSPWTTDLRAIARQFGEQVEAICEQSGYERIHVVGHSMGGIVARYYAQRLGGDARIHTLVTLGSPHSGTGAAHLIPFGVTPQLKPGSPVIRELAEPAPGHRTRYVAVWSDLDALMTPKHTACLDHPDLEARNVLVRGTGHMSLPIDGRVVQEIVGALAYLDSDGSTHTAAVTRLQPAGPAPAGRPEQPTGPIRPSAGQRPLTV